MAAFAAKLRNAAGQGSEAAVVETEAMLKHFESLLAEKDVTNDVLDKYKEYATLLRDWVNSAIRSRGTQVSDLHTSLRSGIALIRLLEVLSGKTLDGYLKAPSNISESLMNLEMLLRGLLTVGVSCDGITSEDVYQGRLPKVVILLVRIAVKFRAVPMPSKKDKKPKKPGGVIGVILDQDTLSQIQVYVTQIEAEEKLGGLGMPGRASSTSILPTSVALATANPVVIAPAPPPSSSAAAGTAARTPVARLRALSQSLQPGQTNPIPPKLGEGDEVVESGSAGRLVDKPAELDRGESQPKIGLEVFTIYTGDSVKKVVYNPGTFLEDLLLRLCEVKDLVLSDYQAQFMDGIPISKLNVSLAELGVHEIKFLEKDSKGPPPPPLALHRFLVAVLLGTNLAADKKKAKKEKRASYRHEPSSNDLNKEMRAAGMTPAADYDPPTALHLFESGEMLMAPASRWQALLQNLLSLESWRTYFVKKNGFKYLFEALGWIENRIRMEPEPSERLFTQLSLTLYSLQALSNQQTPILKTSFPVRLLLDAFRFTDSDYTVVLFDLISKLFVVEGNIPYILVAIKYFLFAEADTFREMLEELDVPTTPMLYRTELLSFLTSILVVAPTKKDRWFLRDEFWRAGVTYEALTDLEERHPSSLDLRECVEYYLDEAEIFDGFLPEFARADLSDEDADEADLASAPSSSSQPETGAPARPISPEAGSPPIPSSRSVQLLAETSKKSSRERQQEETLATIAAFEQAVAELMEAYVDPNAQDVKLERRRSTKHPGLQKISASRSIPRVKELSGSNPASASSSPSSTPPRERPEKKVEVLTVDESPTKPNAAGILRPPRLLSTSTPRSSSKPDVGFKPLSKGTWGARRDAPGSRSRGSGSLLERIKSDFMDVFNLPSDKIVQAIHGLIASGSSDQPAFFALNNIFALASEADVDEAVGPCPDDSLAASHQFVKKLFAVPSALVRLDLLVFEAQMSTLTGSRNSNLRKVKQTLGLLEVPQYASLLKRIRRILALEDGQNVFKHVPSLSLRPSASNSKLLLIQQLVTEMEAEEPAVLEWAKSTTSMFKLGRAMTAIQELLPLFVQKQFLVARELASLSSSSAPEVKDRFSTLHESIRTQTDHIKANLAAVDETLAKLGVIFKPASVLVPQWKVLLDAKVLDEKAASDISSHEALRDEFFQSINIVFTDLERAVFLLSQADEDRAQLSESPFSPRKSDLAEKPSLDQLRSRSRLKLTGDAVVSTPETDFNMGSITRRKRQSISKHKAIKRKEAEDQEDHSGEEDGED